MERDSRMMIRADAKAQGAITAISPRVSDRWKGSGTKSGECVSIFPDGTRIPFVRTRNTETTRKPRTVTIAQASNARIREIARTRDQHDFTSH